MQNHFSKACLLLFFTFASWILNGSDLDAQTTQHEQAQRIAIAIHDNKVELNADSGIDFARIDAIATALEQTGHEDIALFVSYPVSVPSTPTSDYMLLSITGNAVLINSGPKLSTLRRIVEALKLSGVEKVTLVGHTDLYDPKKKEWRVISTNKKLQRSARSTALTRAESNARTR